MGAKGRLIGMKIDMRKRKLGMIDKREHMRKVWILTLLIRLDQKKEQSQIKVSMKDHYRSWIKRHLWLSKEDLPIHDTMTREKLGRATSIIPLRAMSLV